MYKHTNVHIGLTLTQLFFYCKIYRRQIINIANNALCFFIKALSKEICGNH